MSCLCISKEEMLTFHILASLSTYTLNSLPPCSLGPCKQISSSHSYIFNFSFSKGSYLSIYKHVEITSILKTKKKPPLTLPPCLPYPSQPSFPWKAISIPGFHSLLHRLQPSFPSQKPVALIPPRPPVTFQLPNLKTFTRSPLPASRSSPFSPLCLPPSLSALPLLSGLRLLLILSGTFPGVRPSLPLSL